MRLGTSFVTAIALIVLSGGASVTQASSLKDALAGVVTRNGVVSDDGGLIADIQRNAIRSSDFVAVATTPGFTYRYNPELNIFERATSSLGPVFVERAETIGAERFDIALTYLYADFTELNGDSLDDLGGLSIAPGTVVATEFDKFELRSQVMSISATYGVTDRWDVNVLLPLLFTRLKLQGTSRFVSGSSVFSQTFDEDHDKFGVGDILLRTKYRLRGGEGVNVASGVTIRMPSGDDDNFQGLGDVVLTPFLVVSRAFGRNDIHFNLGAETDANDLERSRVRYAGGAAFQVLDPLALLVDIVGSSAFTGDHFSGDLGSGTVARSDIVDVIAGVKMKLGSNILAHLGAIVPITNDGIRADVVPAGGIEASF